MELSDKDMKMKYLEYPTTVRMSMFVSQGDDDGR